MHIVRLVSEFPEKIDRGLGPNVYYLSKYQALDGHRVDVFTFGDKEKTKKIEGFNVHWIKRPRLIRVFGGYFLLKKVKDLGLKPDIVHAMNPLPFGWLFSLGKRGLDSKYIMSFHTNLFPLRYGYVKGFKNLLINFEFTLLSKFLLKRVNLVLPISNFVKDEIKSTGINVKQKVVPSGIELKYFKPMKRKRNRKKTILYVGRFSYMKNVLNLVKACNGLDVNLILIGGKKTDEQYPDVLKELKKSNANYELLEPVPYHQIPRYYSKADLFVLPSLIEPMGKVVLEAIACGLPVLTTSIGGCADIVKEKRDLIDPSDIASIRKKILTWPNSQRMDVLQYDWHIIAKKHIRAYHEITL